MGSAGWLGRIVFDADQHAHPAAGCGAQFGPGDGRGTVGAPCPPRRLAASAGSHRALGWGGPAGGHALVRPAPHELGFRLQPAAPVGRDGTGPAGGASEQIASLSAISFRAGPVAGCPCRGFADSTRPSIGGDRLAHPTDSHVRRHHSRAGWNLGETAGRRGDCVWRLRRV